MGNRGRRGRAVALRGLAVDVTPLRESREFRLLWGGQILSGIGRQITIVAVPYQVYLLTRSSLAVGMLGVVQVVPLVVFSLGGGAIADAVDRRKLVLASQVSLAALSLALAVSAWRMQAPLWVLYVLSGISSGVAAVEHPARSAIVPRLVSRERLPAALALQQVLYQVAHVAGPALGGVVINRYGLVPAYAIDVAAFATSMAAVWAMAPQPPDEGASRPGLAAIREGFSYLRRRPVLLSTFAIDLNAMIFGMPRALFPAMAEDVFRVGPAGLGLLHAAPAAGALVGALFTGWVGRIRRQGLAVIWAVVVWGTAIALFGVVTTAFWLGLAFLAVAGAADVVSAVFRGAILQLDVPDALRGRIIAVHIMVVTSGPRLGDVEAGVVAALTSVRFSVISGGLACVAGAAILTTLVPALRRYRPDLDDRG